MRLTMTVLIKMTYPNVMLFSTHVLVPDVLFQNWYVIHPSGTFINSLKKFVWRKCSPESILPDNGRPFAADTTPQFVSNVNIH